MLAGFDWLKSGSCSPTTVFWSHSQAHPRKVTTTKNEMAAIETTTTTMAVAVKDATAAEIAAPREPNVIYEGDAVICQTSDGRQFFEVVKKDQYVQSFCGVRMCGWIFPETNEWSVYLCDCLLCLVQNDPRWQEAHAIAASDRIALRVRLSCTHRCVHWY